ncbi:MAG TPA: ATP-dependent DNA helicase RecG [Thermoanaerobaculia bacterium]|nr:ATP-dependent DNA helicase RecG [Thermoanaerobaculia bacterium]
MRELRRAGSVTPDTPVDDLRGVGEGRAAILQAAGVRTARDLLYFFPFRYEDRRHPIQVRDLRSIDFPVALRGRITSAGLKTTAVRRLQIFEAMFDDGTGTIMLTWFNQAWLANQVKKGMELAIYGQPRISSYGRFQIENPDWEQITAANEQEEEGAIVPVYSSIAGLGSKRIRQIVNQAMPAVAELEDPMPPLVKERLGVIDLRPAVVRLHHPEELDESFVASRSPAHLRLILDEFFSFQLRLRVRRALEENREKERRIVVSDAIRERVRKVLPFRLTGAQKRVLKEIVDDLQSPHPMYRLLQGDVGSGKTIVALISALVVVENGYQTALLAPTEILAEQHYERLRQLVDGGLRIERLTGSMTAKAKKEILKRLSEGEIDLLVGTHAVLESKVEFKSLGLAIVDEQHRFGVAQRQKLFEKGELVDILVMTATPIPRSLALALYGDLELSVIDELPPGRIPIKTHVRGTSQLLRIYQFLEQKLQAGQQAFIVFPIIEESDKIDLKALTTGFEEIRKMLPGRRLGMLHGRMPADEKEKMMFSFKNHAIDVLVATTVIEVGIDVPNASVMIVMDADRFGLSQLHQLRGRIGRGTEKSFCILVRDERTSEEAKSRLKSFESTTDGFQVAERDLQLRGSGDFFGTRQSGMPRFRFGNIVRDHQFMERARDEAVRYLREEGVARSLELVTRMTAGDHGELAKD